MAEYALVTAVMASLVVALASIPDGQLGARLPVTQQKATTLVTQTAKSGRVPVAQARAVLRRAPYPRPALRYLYTAGWITGRQQPAECLFAKATPDATRGRIADSIRGDARLRARLRRMNVTVSQAAGALTSGTAAAC